MAFEQRIRLHQTGKMAALGTFRLGDTPLSQPELETTVGDLIFGPVHLHSLARYEPI
jgi:hypothetical protein